MSERSTKLDWSAIRARIRSEHGRRYWRSLEELAGTPNVPETLSGEWSGKNTILGDEVGRREFLKLMGASLALAGLTACTRQPLQKIVPYVHQPEQIVLGQPLFYATAMVHNGFAQGILVKSYEGHPVKIEGNPEHPISLGATNVFMQASLLDLYDPDRAQSVMHGQDISSWGRFSTVLADVMQQQKRKRGAGLRILTETVTSPTLISQLQAILKQYPEARWHQYQPVNLDNVYEGARLAFGQVVAPQYAFNRASVIVSLGADFLFSHPASLRYARHYGDKRRVSHGSVDMNRLYVAETSLSITGAMAEHRIAIRPSDTEMVARALADSIGVAAGESKTVNLGSRSPEIDKWLYSVVADLRKRAGESIVIAGESKEPLIHAIAHSLNERLGNFGKTVFFTRPVEANATEPQLESLRTLVKEMDSGTVDCLLILGGNPVFNSPADFNFGSHLARVPLSIHLGTSVNETSAACRWFVPETHFLENWSDAAAYDGTVSIMQPLIAPLYQGVSVHELVGALTSLTFPSAYEAVRSYWQGRKQWPSFENDWNKAVHEGLVPGTQAQTQQVRLQSGLEDRIRVQGNQAQSDERPNLEIEFAPDPCIWDGRFANNGWLQELPKPLTKLTWDNAVMISPAMAETLRVGNGDVVRLRLDSREIEIPAWVLPGQARDCVTVLFGNGRSKVGHVGGSVGVNVFPLRSSKTMWFGRGLELVGTKQVRIMADAQKNHDVQSGERQVLFTGTLAEFKQDPKITGEHGTEPPTEETIYGPPITGDYTGYKWAMAIDLTVCIGCNACVLGCYSENNIPVVGKSEVARGRIMEWIRVDSYFQGSPEAPRVAFVPVPCMHCEYAPCELVCPVEATLHDHEGLNLQVYNRCFGTRFCSNNCPYKVRRFNFFHYANYETLQFKPMRNPEVTVRWRGVMEKCTYCVQRISAARIRAQKNNQRIRDGEVQPACAQACPTRTIVFGDLSDTESQVSKLRHTTLNYSMLGELNTRPRTTYLAKLNNPSESLAGQNATEY